MNSNIDHVNLLPETSANASEAHGTQALQRSKERLMLDMKSVVDDAQALFKEAMDTSAEGIAAVPEYLEDRLSAVKNKLHRARTAVESRARHTTEVTAVYIRENPWKSLSFVALGTVVAGLLLLSARTPRAIDAARISK